MQNLLRILVLLPATLFLIMGLAWLLMPSLPAGELGLALQQGLGLSTQIGDLSAFFLTTSICIFAGVFTRNNTWLYPAILLMGLAAFGRIVAFLVHNAPLAIDLIVVEVVVATLLYVYSKKVIE